MRSRQGRAQPWLAGLRTNQSRFLYIYPGDLHCTAIPYSCYSIDSLVHFFEKKLIMFPCPFLPADPLSEVAGALPGPDDCFLD